MSQLSIIDSSFDVNITTSYFLSIQLSLDGFSFCVLDPVSNEYNQFWHTPIDKNQNPFDVLNSELSKNDILIYPYQKVFFSYQSSHYTLIPDSLFKKENAEDYLDFTFTNKKSSINETLTFYNKIKMADSWCIFNIPSNTVELLNKYYPHIQYLCPGIPFIESALLNTSTDSKANHVHININSKSFDVVVTSGNSLLLHNTFGYKNTKDFLYFTLFVFDQLKLDTNKTKVYLSGQISKKSEIYSVLKKYIRKIDISTTTKHFKFTGIFKSIPIEKHLNLFNIPLCV